MSSVPKLDLPIRPPYPPMEAQRADKIPPGNHWQFEPNWDGFRAIIFRDGDKVAIQSKNGQPLGRYFPELIEAFLSLEPKKFILDGEIVTVHGRLSFDDLLLRIHPAESRIRKLAAETPANYFAFDILFAKGKALNDVPIEKRRAKLEVFFDSAGAHELIHLSPCVVGGFRYGEGTTVVGSLLLGLYDDEHRLVYVGHTSSIRKSDRSALTKKLESLRAGNPFEVRVPGGPSRWASERSGEWEPVRPKLVCEVEYDYFSQERFRHGSKFLRWRPDKDPESCTMDQVMPRKERGGSPKKLFS